MTLSAHAHVRPNDTTAAVLSAIIPGAGQMYKGKPGLGIAWLVFTVLGYLYLLVPGLLLHFICVFQAALMAPAGRERDAF